MSEKVSPGKSGIQLGILFGILMILEFVIMYVIGMKSLVNSSVGMLVNILNYMVLPLAFIYIGCTNYKKNNDTYISFSESLKVGVSICFIAAVIYATFNIIFNYIFPDFMDEMLKISKEAILAKNPNMTEDQVEMGLGMIKKFMNPLIAFPVTVAMYAFFGLIYSLIIGAIVKKDHPQSL
jgi:hypothetical protein